MIFCSKCGHEVGEKDLFCGECGARLERQAERVTEQETAIYDSPQPEKPPAEQSLSRKRVFGTWKLLAALAVVLVVALSAGYIAGKSAYSPERMIEAFTQAIEEGDEARLAELLQPKDSGMTLTAQDVSRLAKYYKKHDEDLQDVVELLEKQAAGSEVQDAAYKLVKAGKRWLLYDQYKIEVAPYYLTIETNMEDTILYIDGNEVAKADEPGYSDRFGPYWPGEYAVEALYQGEFTTLRASHTAQLHDELEMEIHLGIAASYAQITSERNDAQVYVNGQPTGRSISEFSGVIGPITYDGQITLQAEAEFPWGVYRSEEIVLSPELEHEVITFQFEDAYEAALEQVMTTVNEFLASWVPAYENMDISLITNVTEERRSLFVSDFQWMLESGQRFTAEIVGTEYDLESFELYGGYNGYPYRAVIEVAYVLSDAAWYFVGETPQLGDMISFIEYELTFDEQRGRWLISYFTALNSIDFSNTQAFTYE